MENVLANFSSISSLILFVSILSYILGYLLTLFLTIEKEEIHTSELSKFTETITIGFFTSVFSAALFYTKGNTSLLAPASVLLFWVFYSKRFRLKPKLNPFLFKKLLFFIISFSLFSIGMSFLLNFDSRLLMHQDILFYARLSHNMATFNLERLVIDPLVVSEYPATIYHYFNEWLTVMGIKFSNLGSLKIFVLFTLPFLSVMLFFNLMSVSEHILKNNNIFSKVLISLLVLSSPGLLSLFLNLITKGSFETSYSVLHGGILFLKLKIVLLIILISVNLYFVNKSKTSLIVFSLIPLLWNSVIPAFIGGFTLLVLYQLITKKKLNKSLVATYTVSFIILGVYFYFNSGEKLQSILSYSLIDYLNEEYSKSAYVLKIFIMIILSLSPLLLVFIKKTRSFFDQEYKYYILFISVSAFASFSLMHKLFNARQIILNFFYPLFIIVILFILIWLFNKSRRFLNFTASFLILLVLGHGFLFARASQSRIEIPAAFKTDNNVLVASDLNKYATPFSFYVRPYSNEMLNYKYWLPQRIDILDKFDYQTPVEKLEFLQSVSGQSFFKYVSKSQTNLDLNNINDLKYHFLKEFEFKYLLVDSARFYENTLMYKDRLEIKSIANFDKNVLILELNWK
jgi:hypothetical protein